MVAAQFTFLPTVPKGPFPSHPCQHLVVSCFFDNGHSNRCAVVSHCGFDLHFPDHQWRWVPVLVWPSVCLLGKMLIQILLPFFNRNFFGGVVFVYLLFSYMSSLYILDISPSSDMIPNVFSHSVGSPLFWVTHFGKWLGSLPLLLKQFSMDSSSTHPS